MTFKTNNYYSTADLALSATISLFIPIEKVIKTNSRRALFLFRKSKRLKNLINSYWKNRLLVDPQRYFQQLKLIKNRLYAEKRI